MCEYMMSVELVQDSVLTLYQHWTKISNSVSRSMEWPERRGGHAATCVSGPLLVIMGGGMSKETMTSDCWIYDFTTMLWKKVLASEICFLYFMTRVTSCTCSFDYM